MFCFEFNYQFCGVSRGTPAASGAGLFRGWAVHRGWAEPPQIRFRLQDRMNCDLIYIIIYTNIICLTTRDRAI